MAIRIRVHTQGGITLINEGCSDSKYLTTYNPTQMWKDAGIPTGTVLDVSDTEVIDTSIATLKAPLDPVEIYIVPNGKQLWFCTRVLRDVFGHVPQQLWYKEVTTITNTKQGL